MLRVIIIIVVAIGVGNPLKFKLKLSLSSSADAVHGKDSLLVLASGSRTTVGLSRVIMGSVTPVTMLPSSIAIIITIF